MNVEKTLQTDQGVGAPWGEVGVPKGVFLGFRRSASLFPFVPYSSLILNISFSQSGNQFVVSFAIHIGAVSILSIFTTGVHRQVIEALRSRVRTRDLRDNVLHDRANPTLGNRAIEAKTFTGKKYLGGSFLNPAVFYNTCFRQRGISGDSQSCLRSQAVPCF